MDTTVIIEESMTHQTKSISREAVFVVSGGARGITAHCVIQLARHYRCKFILLGRSARTTPESQWVDPQSDETSLKRQVSAQLSAQGEKPAPARVGAIVRAILAEREITATLDAIAQAGGQAEYVSVDITDGAALREQLASAVQRMGRVTGIIHGAGTLADKLIEKKSADDFDRVYGTKITGLHNLLTCISPAELDYLVLFASVAGFYGNIGQADYAIANEIFNKTAYLIRRAYPACRVISINWGPWDGGMVTPTLKKYFTEHNIALISPDDGAHMLIRELEQVNDNAPQVIIGNPIKMSSGPTDAPLRTHRIRRALTLEATPSCSTTSSASTRYCLRCSVSPG